CHGTEKQGDHDEKSEQGAHPHGMSLRREDGSNSAFHPWAARVGACRQWSRSDATVIDHVCERVGSTPGAPSERGTRPVLGLQVGPLRGTNAAAEIAWTGAAIVGERPRSRHPRSTSFVKGR